MKNNKINEEWYCVDCYSNHHCINCPYMDELEFHHNFLLGIIDIEDEISSNKNINKWNITICGCWKTKSPEYPMCRECYWKSKL